MSYLIAILCGLSILVGQYFYGGIFRPILAFPSYLIVVGACFLAACCRLFVRRESPRIEGVILVLLLLLWLVGQIFGSGAFPQGPALLELGLGCFLIYLLMAYEVVQPEARVAFLVVILVGAMAQSVAAGGQFFGLWAGLPQGWVSEQLRLWYDRGDTATIYRRAHGFYINGNHLAWFLNSAGFFALALGGFGRGRVVAKVIWIYVGLVCLVVSLLCLSRGGLLALGAGMIFLFVLSILAISFGGRSRRLASWGVLIGAFVVPIGLVLLVASQNDSIRARMGVLFEEGYRPQVWLAALREFQLYPLFGAGPGAFTYFSRQFRPQGASADDYFAHNDWLQLAADFGFPALALVLLIVLFHLAIGCGSFLRILRSRGGDFIPQSNRAAILIGACASTVAFAVHSFFDFNMQLPANALFAAACLGMLVNSGEGSRKGLEMAAWQRWTPRASVTLLIGGGLSLLACLWGNRYEYERLVAENYLLNGEFALAWQIADEAPISGDMPFSLRYLVGAAHQKQAEMATDPEKRKEELEPARNALRMATRMAPGERSANLELARNLLLAGKAVEAKELAFMAIRMEPRQVTGYELYGALLEREGAMSEAQQVYLMGKALYQTDFINERLDALSKKEQ